LAAKVAGNKSIDSCMTACNNKSGWRKTTTTNQPTLGEAKAGSGGGSDGDSNGSGNGGGGQ
jgi:hypothetical protein